MFRTRTRTRTRTRALTRTPSALVFPAAACAAALTAVLAAPATHAAPPPRAAPASAAPYAGTGPGTDAGTSAERDGHTGSEIHRFLAGFYGSKGPTPAQRERHVSDFLKSKQAQRPGTDVLMCTQNTPRDLAIGPVTVSRSDGFGWAPVTAYWADGTTSTFAAYVALDSRPIELHDVVCSN